MVLEDVVELVGYLLLFEVHTVSAASLFRVRQCQSEFHLIIPDALDVFSIADFVLSLANIFPYHSFTSGNFSTL